MAWPQRTHWTPEQARVMGRKGGAVKRAMVVRTPDYKRGYQAGWKACERFYRRFRGERRA